ncbi:hypothetical protein Anapl_13665 [Anas platyrhynchos]|uniref:Uncharacterized protein n=1 Tax=Anas platyrhynchos TaxID=8839 RepID=R0K727_ANAPL|nr:hypothetical protein Anapl_13665 [Anas platyrhynchos]
MHDSTQTGQLTLSYTDPKAVESRVLFPSAVPERMTVYTEKYTYSFSGSKPSRHHPKRCLVTQQPVSSDLTCQNIKSINQCWNYFSVFNTTARRGKIGCLTERKRNFRFRDFHFREKKMSKIEPNTQEELTLQCAWKEQIALDGCGLRLVPAVSQELFWVLLYSDGTSRQDIQVHFVCGHLGISMLYLLCMLHTAGTPLKSVLSVAGNFVYAKAWMVIPGILENPLSSTVQRFFGKMCEVKALTPRWQHSPAELLEANYWKTLYILEKNKNRRLFTASQKEKEIACFVSVI